MGRPIKDGVDFFSLDCRMDDEIRYIEAEFGLDGFATVIKLWQAIYGNKGYYMVFTRTVRLMFAGEIGKSVNFVDEVVSRCMEYGVFDRRIYKNYGVLTSSGIQKRYAKMTERRNLLKIDGRYLLISAPENWVIVNNNRVNVDNNRVNVDNNGESKKKVKESKRKEKENTTTTTGGEVCSEEQRNDVVLCTNDVLRNDVALTGKRSAVPGGSTAGQENELSGEGLGEKGFEQDVAKGKSLCEVGEREFTGGGGYGKVEGVCSEEQHRLQRSCNIVRRKATSFAQCATSFAQCATPGPPKVWEVKKYFEESDPKFTPGILGESYDALSEAEKFCAYNALRGWSCLPNWQAAADLWATRTGSTRRQAVAKVRSKSE